MMRLVWLELSIWITEAFIHFEDGVWFYKNDVVQDILKDFQETLNYCDPISIEFCKNRNIFVRGIQSIMRVFAPLL